jgi:hypothetical protein
MKCKRDYVQQTSTARETFDFCSAECELENKFPIMCRATDTATRLFLTVKRGIRSGHAAVGSPRNGADANRALIGDVCSLETGTYTYCV